MRRETCVPLRRRRDGSLYRRKHRPEMRVAEEFLILLLLTSLFLLCLSLALLTPYGVAHARQRTKEAAVTPPPPPVSHLAVELPGDEQGQSSDGDGAPVPSVVSFVRPVEGRLTGGFGERRNPYASKKSEFHAGQDIAAAAGTPVAAAAAGVVTFAGWQTGYGRVVIIDHGDRLATRYAHLSRVDVAAGQTVAVSSQVGLVGSTGRATGPHLHFEVRLEGQPVNPQLFLPYGGE